MQLRVSYILFPALLIGIAHAGCAYGAAPQGSASSSATVLSRPDCGKSVGDALKAARASLAANDPAHDRSALACLLSVVEALNGQRLDVMRGTTDAPAHLLAVPKDSGRP